MITTCFRPAPISWSVTVVTPREVLGIDEEQSQHDAEEAKANRPSLAHAPGSRDPYFDQAGLALIADPRGTTPNYPRADASFG
jgi:hypothetical protein